MRTVVPSLRERSQQSGLHGRPQLDKDRKRAIVLIVFGTARMAVWTVFAVFVALGLLGVTAFSWSSTLAATVVFVTFISLYANWATDLDQVTAAFAALVASDAHQDSEHTRERLGIDFSLLESDISQLAELQPGPEAWTLAADIRERLHNQGA